MTLCFIYKLDFNKYVIRNLSQIELSSTALALFSYSAAFIRLNRSKTERNTKKKNLLIQKSFYRD